MPTINKRFDSYFWLLGGHLQTVLPFVIEKSLPKYTRSRIELPDGDFLDLDGCYHAMQPESVVLLLHGLEGSSNSGYLVRFANTCYEQGFDCVALNFRGCSGTPNRLFRAYHSGATDDLECIINYLELRGYKYLYLVGFSLGGNVLLTYLGREVGAKPTNIVRAAAISTPVWLHDSAHWLSRWDNKVYLNRFLKSMKLKLQYKHTLYPPGFSAKRALEAQNFETFDDAYTAPAHGFASAEVYYYQSSAARYLAQIKVPTLLINAQNDPFLAPSCVQASLTDSLQHVVGWFPSQGGHVGFLDQKGYASDRMLVEWLTGTFKP